MYRARDARLDRDVAVKVLPAAFGGDADRLARFEREAKAIAALSHPNVVAVFDTGVHQGQAYVVMELLAGQTLRERLATGALPVRKAVDIAVQIARGLGAAHGKGVVHRDLKPENLFLLDDGQVKILDFGLARQVSATEGSGATQTMAATDPGTVMGTVGYMAPEQVRGQAVDARADVFAFGAVLHEMVSGQRAFLRDTAADTMTAILTQDPPELVGSRPDLSPALDRIIRHCLEKNANERFQSARDIAFALETLSGSSSSTAGAPSGATPAPAPASRRRTVSRFWAVSGLAVLAIAGVMTMPRWLRGDDRVTYSGIHFGAAEFASDPRVSPNGSLVAFQTMVDGQTQLAVLQPESGDSTVLTRDRSRGAISAHNWSPDGTSIYYGRIDGVPRGVFSVSAVGGEERLVLEDAVCPQVLPDGSFVVVRVNEHRQYQLYRYWPDTRRLQPYPALVHTDVAYTRIVQAFRDGQEVVFWGRPADQPDADQSDYLQVLNLATGAVRRVPMTTDSKEAFSVAASADDRAILTFDRRGDLTRLIAIPRAGGPTRELMPFATNVSGLDVGPNGDIYLGQHVRPFEATMLGPDGNQPQTLLTFNASSTGNMFPEAAALPDGRLVFPVRRAGGPRLLVAKAGQAPGQFIQTDDETSGPIAAVGTEEVAFLVGKARTLAIASVSDGRILRRLDQAHADAIVQMSGSPDGRTVFSAAAGKIWSIAASGDGKPEAVRDGDAVAADPRGDSLIIQLNEPNNVRFIRRAWPGGSEQPLSFPGVRPATTAMSGNAIGPNGVLLKNANYTDSWPWNLALLHPGTGKVQRVILPALDVQAAGWTASGRIIVFAARTSSTIWRLRPITGGE